MEARGNAEARQSTWEHVVARGSTWKLVEARGSTWKHVEARGSTWKHVEVRGSTWKHVEARWAFKLTPFGAYPHFISTKCYGCVCADTFRGVSAFYLDEVLWVCLRIPFGVCPHRISTKHYKWASGCLLGCTRILSRHSAVGVRADTFWARARILSGRFRFFFLKRQK